MRRLIEEKDQKSFHALEQQPRREGSGVVGGGVRSDLREVPNSFTKPLVNSNESSSPGALSLVVPCSDDGASIPFSFRKSLELY